MHLSYQWKKDFFSNTYHICKENQLIGSLTSKSFSQISEGKLNGKSYTFVTRGFLNQNTDIIDSVSKKLIGQITYNSSMTKATITFADKTIHWKYDNAWNTKWSITDESGTVINYSGSSGNGRLETNTDDALLLLCGLFVTNYFWRMIAVVMIAIFIPIWVTVMN